jgi:hypothetical protein
MSGAVYAQSTPSVQKPVAPTAEMAKAKPAPNHVAKDSKDKPAAVSGANATPVVKSPKHEHAARVAKPAVVKPTKSETPDAKKLETTPSKESKSNVAKPTAVKKPVDAANKASEKPSNNATK